MIKFFCLLMLAAAGAEAQTVEGDVINPATGKGIAGVKVQIAGGKTVFTLTTDETGHFLAEGVKNGLYKARFQSPDYWPSDAKPPVRTFQVTAGSAPQKLEVHMLPLPKIAGRVVFRRGEAVPDALMVMAGITNRVIKTDSQGKFEVKLIPGAYTLSVAPPRNLEPPDPEPDSEFKLGWTRTFYPGVAIPEAASIISLRPGSDVLGLELKLLAVPQHAVSGVLLNPDGAPVPASEITLGEGPQYPAAWRTRSEPDGTFEFPAVVDGEWRLEATVGNGNAALKATQWIEMTGREIEGVKLHLSPPFTVGGKVVMETPQTGAPSPKPPEVVHLGVHGSPISAEIVNRLGGIQSSPDSGGRFSLEGVYPGAYTVSAAPTPPGYYLDAILLGDREVTAPEVSLSGPVSVSLVYKTHGGVVRGAVEECVWCTVWLIPQDAGLRRAGFVSAVACDSNDHYEVAAVRPGDYFALALTWDSPMPWHAGKFDEDVLKRAGRLTVKAGEISPADLRLIKWPPN